MPPHFVLRTASLAVLLAFGTNTNANEVILPTVNVDATALQTEQTATSPVKGYVAKRSATATKTDTPIVETPQSVSVVGAEEIKAIGATNMVEALAYTPGVINNYGFDPSTESYIFRGFQQWGNTLRDGLRYGGAFGWGGYQEVYGLERVEFMKGAASVLYGQQSPGGMVNSVSKRPRADLVQEVAAEYGSFNHRAVKADVGGQFSDSLLWRLTALTNKADSQIDYISSDRLYIAPSLLWQPTAATKLTLLPYYQKGNLARSATMPYKGTILPNKWGKIPRNRFLGEPDEGKSPNLNWGIGVEFEHAFSERNKMAVNLRYSRNSVTWNYSDPYRLEADERSLYRYATRDYQSHDRNLSADIRLQQVHQWGGVEHKLLAGLDASDERAHSAGRNWSYDSFGPIDMFDPKYGQLPDYVNTGKPNPQHDLRNRGVGLYLQDQISIGEQWRVLLGGRQSWVRQYDYAEGRSWNGVNQRNQQFSANAGVVYLGANGISPYASFSQSFQQEIGKLQDGSAMKPTEGEQFEAGIRWQPRGENGPLLSLSTYQLTKTNVAKSDPANPSYSIQVGAIRSRGVELEAKGSFTKHLSGSIGYAYTDARTTRSTTASEIGQRTGGVPLHQASAWLDVDGGLFNLAGLKLGTGVRYTSQLPIEGETFSAPANTELDARLQYKLRNWQYDLSVTNLLDKVGYANCNWGRCGFTKARTINGSVAYRF